MVVNRKQADAGSDPRVLAAFPGLMVIGSVDDLDTALEVAMSEDWVGYFNMPVWAKVNALHPERFTHVQLVPDPAGNMVIVVPCTKSAYGATEVKFSPTENAATINLRLAMKPMNVTQLAGRVRIFDITTREGADGKTYVAIVTKPSNSRPAKKLKKEEANGTAQSGQSGSEHGNTEKGDQPEAQESASITAK